ncbi:MAG: hypothetical protein D6744_15990 [Planctomycetota bacterium]|nr:MAG: hypothetical protein D6744_15990 [Planctomycetota bacterium]
MRDHRNATPLATLIATLAAVLAGCTAPSVVLPPSAARQAVARIERNYERLTAPVTSKTAHVAIRFRDDDGRIQRIPSRPARLIFQAPRCLYFDIRSDVGSIARIASNDERYWAWVDVPERRQLWWGTWSALEAGKSRPMVVPPDLLLDALLLRAPPMALPAGIPPRLEQSGATRRLVYQRIDEMGYPYDARVIELDPRPPYLPTRMLDKNAEGEILMDAHIGRYRPLVDGEAYCPGHYQIEWPKADASMRLDVSEMRFRTSDLPFCEFPDRFNGAIESLDVPPISLGSGRLSQ